MQDVLNTEADKLLLQKVHYLPNERELAARHISSARPNTKGVTEAPEHFYRIPSPQDLGNELPAAADLDSVFFGGWGSPPAADSPRPDSPRTNKKKDRKNKESARGRTDIATERQEFKALAIKTSAYRILNKTVNLGIRNPKPPPPIVKLKPVETDEDSIEVLDLSEKKKGIFGCCYNGADSDDPDKALSRRVKRRIEKSKYTNFASRSSSLDEGLLLGGRARYAQHKNEIQQTKLQADNDLLMQRQQKKDMEIMEKERLLEEERIQKLDLMDVQMATQEKRRQKEVAPALYGQEFESSEPDGDELDYQLFLPVVEEEQDISPNDPFAHIREYEREGKKHDVDILTIWLNDFGAPDREKSFFSRKAANPKAKKSDRDTMDDSQVFTKLLTEQRCGIAFVPNPDHDAKKLNKNTRAIICQLIKEYCNNQERPRIALVAEGSAIPVAANLLTLSPFILGMCAINCELPTKYDVSLNTLKKSMKPKLFISDQEVPGDERLKRFARKCSGSNDTVLISGHGSAKQVSKSMYDMFLRDLLYFDKKERRMSRHIEQRPDGELTNIQTPVREEVYDEMKLWDEETLG